MRWSGWARFLVCWERVCCLLLLPVLVLLLPQALCLRRPGLRARLHLHLP